MKRFRDSEYFVSTTGDVFRKDKKLKQQKSTKGYYYLRLSTYNRKMFMAHRLVAEIYVPNPHNKTQVNHINGVKTDNRVENLEWVSNGENQIHAYNIGLQKTKLTKEQVLQIRSSKNKSSRELGLEFNVHRRTIERILKRQLWNRV